MKQPEIYFHVGLGKTASTHLQKKVFPNLTGVQYIPPERYKKSRILIEKSTSDKILVSREFDRQLEREVMKFVNDFPIVRIIVCFRRQDQWLASQYRRHVKNGFTGDIQDFVDLENDTGLWSVNEFYYQPKLQFINSVTNSEPLVLRYDDLKNSPQRFVDQIVSYTGTRITKVNFRKVHRSFSDHQLLVLRSICRKLKIKAPKGKANKLLHWVTFRPVWLLFHVVLYASRLVPKSGSPNRDLISKKYLHDFREVFEKDWEAVCNHD